MTVKIFKISPISTQRKAGLGICSLVFWANGSFFCERKSDWLVKKIESLPSLFCLDRPELTVALFINQWEQFTHGRSFVKGDKSKLHPSIFKKERLSEAQRGRFALVHKIGGNQWTTVKNIRKFDFFSRKSLVFREQFARITSKSLMLFFLKDRQERFAHCRSLKFKLSDFEQKSEERMSERANFQTWLRKGWST